jgi:hypothetical protein
MEKSALLLICHPEDRIEVPVLDQDGNLITDWLRVRGLTRGEWLTVGKITGDEPDVAAVRRGESFSVSVGLLEPRLTLEEASEWLENAPASITSTVVNRIMELTGARGGAPKEAYKSLRG